MCIAEKRFISLILWAYEQEFGTLVVANQEHTAMAHTLTSQDEDVWANWCCTTWQEKLLDLLYRPEWEVLILVVKADGFDR